MAQVDEQVRNFRRVVDLAVEYHDHAVRCADAGCFPAACVMIGAALEAELLVMAIVFETESKQLWPSGKGRPETWGFNELATLALDAGWFATQLSDAPAQNATTREHVIQMLDFVREVRNRAAHAGRIVRETGLEPSQRAYEVAYAVTRATFDYTYAYFDGQRRLDQSDV